MHAASLALLALALTLLDAAGVSAAKRKPCGDTSWVVEDAPILPDDASLQHNGVVLRDGRLAVGGGCPAVKAKRKAGKKGTRLAARWKSCAGVTGPVRFKGTTDPTCATLSGTLRARKGGLRKAIAAVAVPTGVVTGQVRVVRRVAVPVEARAGVLDYRAQLEASGRSLAADGSTVDDPPSGAAGWLVRSPTARSRCGSIPPPRPRASCSIRASRTTSPSCSSACRTWPPPGQRRLRST
jgi:hypothetical protein